LFYILCGNIVRRIYMHFEMDVSYIMTVE